MSPGATQGSTSRSRESHFLFKAKGETFLSFNCSAGAWDLNMTLRQESLELKYIDQKNIDEHRLIYRIHFIPYNDIGKYTSSLESSYITII